MCRQGGYYDQAVFLATKHGEHELVVDILIEDSKKYADALDYIWRLGPDLSYPLLMKYARILLEHCAKDATQLFIDYYTGAYTPRKKSAQTTQDATPIIGPSAVQNLASFIPLPYRQASVVPTSAAGGNQQTTFQQVDSAVPEMAPTAADYDVPKPRTAFSSFVDHPQEFIVFLEACLDQEELQDGDKTDLYTTLFELYLETANSRRGLDREEWESKAKRLIDGKDVRLDSVVGVEKSDFCRFLSIHQTSSCCLTYQISKMARSWFASNKVFVSTSSDPIPPPMTPWGLSKRSESMVRRSRSCIRPR